MPPAPVIDLLNTTRQELEDLIEKFLQRKTELLLIESEIVTVRERIRSLQEQAAFSTSQDFAQLEDPQRDREIQDFRTRLPALLALLDTDKQL